MKNNKRRAKGITLIALVITIIILLLLAGVTISAIVNGGLITRANEAQFKTRMAEFRDTTNQYVAWVVSDTLDTDTSKINSGEVLKDAIDREIVTDIQKEDVTINIGDILKNIKNKEKDLVVVYKGELCYVSNDKNENNEKQVKWCEEIGIKVLQYTEPEGIVVRNGKYELVNGVYLCTPKLNEGFKDTRTRYLEVNNQGNLTPGKWIDQNPTESWYDYKNSKWANILVENNGSEVYYTWIPRYCFKLDQGKQTSDVKFIDMYNNYKDEDGNVIPWESTENENGEKIEGLKEQGYQIPDAFWFDKNNNGIEDDGEQLAGYWAMKYTAGEIVTPSTVDFDLSVSRGIMNVKNIRLNTSITGSNPITKYTVSLNGVVEKTITDVSNIGSQVITLQNMKAGDNTINVTGLNANGEVVGSMTKDYSPGIVNAPDLSGFNKETTFYVTYDENEKEHSTTPISEATPQYWYEYGESRWANIVTRNNGLETYYTWIPRYAFTLDQTNQKSTVKFLSGTTRTVDGGYQIPDAFWFDKNSNGKEDDGEQLTGYWAMKYTAGTETVPTFDTELVATSSSIRTKGITGTAVASGQVYNYYINGEYKGQKTSATDIFEYSGLNSNTKYTVLIEIRNSSDEYVGSVVKQISTIDANKPELTGFNAEQTYYVLYDNEGNETIGDKIKSDGSNLPSNWYDYSSSKWANIVVTDGTVSGGKITGATKTTYFTWIPRYEFRINAGQQLQAATARTEVRFLQGTSKDTDAGYQIPDAFWFDKNSNGKEDEGEQLTGYWVMKYTAGN